MKQLWQGGVVSLGLPQQKSEAMHMNHFAGAYLLVVQT